MSFTSSSVNLSWAPPIHQNHAPITHYLIQAGPPSNSKNKMASAEKTTVDTIVQNAIRKMSLVAQAKFFGYIKI
jgi:hypothetical protein